MFHPQMWKFAVSKETVVLGSDCRKVKHDL